MDSRTRIHHYLVPVENLGNDIVVALECLAYNKKMLKLMVPSSMMDTSLAASLMVSVASQTYSMECDPCYVSDKVFVVATIVIYLDLHYFELMANSNTLSMVILIHHSKKLTTHLLLLTV